MAWRASCPSDLLLSQRVCRRRSVQHRVHRTSRIPSRSLLLLQLLLLLLLLLLQLLLLLLQLLLLLDMLLLLQLQLSLLQLLLLELLCLLLLHLLAGGGLLRRQVFLESQSSGCTGGMRDVRRSRRTDRHWVLMVLMCNRGLFHI